MADTLFTQLPVATALTGSEVVPVDQPNANPPGTWTTKQTTTGAIARALSPTSAVMVDLQSGTTYSVAVADRAKLITFSNVAPIAVNLPPTGIGATLAAPSWFVQFENRGPADLTITPFAGGSIDGASSLTLTQNQGVLLAVGADNNWYTQRGAGLTALTAVTSVGLALPVSVFTVSGSPVTTTGTLTGTLVAQGANMIWSGPAAGAAAAPTFRSLVTADLPDYGTPATYGDASTVPVITTDAKGRVTATTAPITAGSIATLAGLSVVGRSANTTGVSAAITATLDGQILRLSGSTLGFGALNLSSTNAVTGTLPAGNGGTGQATYAIGDLLYASAANALSRLAGVAIGNALISGGVGAAPSWGKIGLTTHITGTLSVANGGTGATTLTSNGILLGNGASAVSATAAMTDGQVLVGQTGAAPLPRTATGDLSISAAGAFTLGNNVVTNAKAAQMATLTIKSNITGGTANAADNTLTAIIDAAIGATQGNILYRAASAWAALAPGTAGYVLQTNGAAANPSWVPGAGSFSPQSQTAAGVGQVVAVTSTTGSGLVLPAGGTWEYLAFGYANPALTITAPIQVGVAAGGTTVIAGVAGTIFTSRCKRIA